MNKHIKGLKPQKVQEEIKLWIQNIMKKKVMIYW